MHRPNKCTERARERLRDETKNDYPRTQAIARAHKKLLAPIMLVISIEYIEVYVCPVLISLLVLAGQCIAF